MEKKLIKWKIPSRNFLKKMFLIMRLCLIFLLTSTLNLFAIGSYSQDTRLTLELRDVTVKEALRNIENSSEFFFIYNNELIDVNRKVDVNVKNEKISHILSEIFAGQQVDVTVIDRKIVLAPSSMGVQQTQGSITGKVTDVSGVALPGVSVVIKGTTTGIITDNEGVYSFSKVPENAILVFSFVGMKTQEVKVGDKTVINVVLSQEELGLEEVVVVGYGTQKKVNLTGSISQIKADELTNIPVPTLAQAAMGKASGLFIKNVNGQPGDSRGVQLNIRGFGSPLYVVDGIAVTENVFQQLDPNDIESFNVLKDAASGAVYGARAGNGVILVTTKRGGNSKPQFTYNGNYGLQFITAMPDYVNSEQYARMENAARYNQGLAPLWTAEEIQKFHDNSDPLHYPNTDWYGATLRKYAPQSQHNINVRGGSEKVKYFVSGGYYHQEGILRSDDTKNDRYTLRSNLDIELTKKFRVGLDINLSNQDFLGPRNQLERRGSVEGIMTALFRTRPYWLNEPFPDPSYAHAAGTMTTANEVSPVTLSQISTSGYMKWTRMVGDAKINFAYDLPFGFKAKAIFDLNRAYYRYKEKVANTSIYIYNFDTQVYKYVDKVNALSRLIERQEITNNITQQYFLTWDKKIKNHSLSALAVYENLSNDYDYFTASRQDYAFNLDYLFAGPDLNKDNNGGASEGGRKAYIGRINYDFKNKYLLELNARYDGSANFPPETRWGFFPSASAGWRISEEEFFKEALPFVNNLKLRASHGLLGYDAAGNFQYLATYSIKSSYIYDNSNVLSTGVRANTLPNLGITWEKMRTTNIGMDFNLWNNTLEGSVEYFYRKRSDVLGQRMSSIPDIVGANMPNVNYASYDNRGWELNLNHEGHVLGEVKYNFGGNISLNREKTRFIDQAVYGNDDIRRRSNQIGEWTDRLWTYPTAGLFKTKEEIQSWADIDGRNNATIMPGDVKYIDSNGDGRISAEDMIIAGRGTFPRLTYGLNMSVEWKGLSFSMLWQGAGLYNINLRNAPDLTYPFYAGDTPTVEMLNNSYVSADNPWLPANTNARWPLFRTDSYNRSHKNYNTASQFWLVDGSYIRLKNVQLAYSIPQKIIGKWGIQKCQVYVSGSNLLTFFKYKKLIDPEIDTAPTTTFGDYHPPLGNYNMGIVVNF